jgi:hypothetical protein
VLDAALFGGAAGAGSHADLGPSAMGKAAYEGMLNPMNLLGAVPAGVAAFYGPAASLLKRAIGAMSPYHPTPNAQRLIDAGVEGLSTGQMAGTGTLPSKLESGLANGLREEPMNSWRESVIKKTVAPGEEYPGMGEQFDARELMDRIAAGYEAPYQKALTPQKQEIINSDMPMEPYNVTADSVASKINSLSNSKRFEALPSTRETLQDKLNYYLKEYAKDPDAMTTKQLQELRTTVREMKANSSDSAASGGDKLSMLQAIDKAITNKIKGLVPEIAQNDLPNIDKQYANMMRLKSAVEQNKLFGAFSPVQVASKFPKGSPFLKSAQDADVVLGNGGLSKPSTLAEAAQVAPGRLKELGDILKAPLGMAINRPFLRESLLHLPSAPGPAFSPNEGVLPLQTQALISVLRGEKDR